MKKSRQQTPSILGQYWMVILGSGLSMILVVAGLSMAVIALKAKEPPDNGISLARAGQDLRHESPTVLPVQMPAALAEKVVVTKVEKTVSVIDTKSSALLTLPKPQDVPEMRIETASPAEPVAVVPDVTPASKPMLEISKKGTALKPAGDTYGTKVHFQPVPASAYKKALAEHKLVFILHVSGNFEDPQFT